MVLVVHRLHYLEASNDERTILDPDSIHSALSEIVVKDVVPLNVVMMVQKMVMVVVGVPPYSNVIKMDLMLNAPILDYY